MPTIPDRDPKKGGSVDDYLARHQAESRERTREGARRGAKAAFFVAGFSFVILIAFGDIWDGMTRGQWRGVAGAIGFLCLGGILLRVSQRY